MDNAELIKELSHQLGFGKILRAGVDGLNFVIRCTPQFAQQLQSDMLSKGVLIGDIKIPEGGFTRYKIPFIGEFEIEKVDEPIFEMSIKK